METQDKAMSEQMRREWQLEKKSEAQIRLYQRAKERNLLDSRVPTIFKASSMNNLPRALTYDPQSTSEVVARNYNASNHTRSKDNLWNYLQKAEKKRIEAVIRPVVIKGEEEALKNVMRKIDQEK